MQGDIAFTIDKSSRELFVNENLITKPLAGSPKNYKRLGMKSALEEEVIQYIPPQSSGIVHMPLFDFEAFSIFAENYIISSENVAVACDINGEVLMHVVCVFVPG